MANVRELKNRIKAVQKTQQITRAMKMVATVRYKRAHESWQVAKPYLQEVQGLRDLTFRLPGVTRHALFERRKVERLGVVVWGSDKGLCGSFNSNLFRLALRRVADEIESGKNVEIIPVGRKARDYFKRLPYSVGESSVNVTATMAQAETLSHQWAEGFLSGRFDQIITVHNRFKNVMQCLPTAATLFPLKPAVGEQEFPFDTLIEPTVPAWIDYAVRTVSETTVFQMLLDSNASEQGIRMSMMDQATQKADDLIRELTIQRNKARQTAITNELIEMTAAAEALQ